MRLRKEKKTIFNSEKIALELNKLYKEGLYIDEYKKLLAEYKKLDARYDKNIKVSDTIEHSILRKKEDLNKSLDYTIKTARSHLFNNIDEHKKTKNALFSYKEKVEKYKKALDILLKERVEFQKSLDIYIKHYGEIKHEFYESFEDSEILDNKKEKELKNISLEKILTLVSKNNKEYFLLKLELKDFTYIREKITLTSSIKSFIENLQKFIENNLDEEAIVYFDKEGIFYILLVNKTVNDIENFENKINHKRDIFDCKISFNISASKLEKTNDTISELIRRCNKGLEEAKRKDIHLIIKEKEWIQ